MENYLDIKHKFEQGTVAEYDLIRANVTVKNSEPNMLQAENALVLAKWQLKALLGMDLDINIECEGQLIDFEKDLFGDFLSTDTTLANNTDLKQIDLQAKQLEKTLTMQKFDYLPTLSLTGLYQWTAMNNDFKFKDYMWNPYSMVGLSLSIPIFSGGSKFYKIKQTRNSIEQLSLQREDTQRNLQLAIKQYIDNMNLRQTFRRFTKGSRASRTGIYDLTETIRHRSRDSVRNERFGISIDTGQTEFQPSYLRLYGSKS